jgi:uncharacterized protein (DUF58 family)
MASSILLSSSFLQTLEKIVLLCGSDISSGAGMHLHPRAAGAGIEFADFRSHSMGEDSRYLDWNAYLRLGRLFVKVYASEQNTRVYLLLDCSASMDCEAGIESKLLYAQRLAATFAYLALLHLDTAVVVPFAEGIHTPFTASGGRNRFWSVLQYLAQLKAGGRTDLRRSVREFVQTFRTRGTVIVLSDLFDEESCAAAVQMLQSGGYDFVLVQVHSAEEQLPSIAGEFTLEDVETGDRQRVASSPEAALLYERSFLDYSERLRQLALRYGGRYARAVTDVSYEEFVLQSLTANRVVA